MFDPMSAQPHSYSSILSLARSGATQRAWDAFVAAGLDRFDDDFGALTLKGRLLKDRARRAEGAERAALFAAAGAAYERAATLRPDSYPLINAAAMALFAGERTRAELLASKVQHLIESGEDKGETPYWGEATRAEALLLLGRTKDAKASLAAAIALAPQAWEDHAATLGQFTSILECCRADRSWLDKLRPPRTLHFSGILGIDAQDGEAPTAIEAAITALAPGFGYGALAAGADIIAAEILQAHGAELHVVLPAEPEEFRTSSVDSFGADWSHRFDRLLADAHSLSICGQSEPMSAAGVTLAEHHAMGLAIEKAAQLQTEAVALRMQPAERPVVNDLWVKSDRPLHRVELRISSKVAAQPLPEGKLVIDGDPPKSFASLNAAVAALRDAGDEPAVLDCRIGERSNAAALAVRGQRGVIVASRSAALMLLAAGIATRIENIGEMATNDGALEICLVALRATPD
jgi:hypothetical protein